MSTPKWKKRWLYDSKVEIPKTTKWRRGSERINPGFADDIRLGDVQEDFSSETIHGVIDLGNNTSPFKKQRILGDCLSNTQTKALSLIMCPSDRKSNSGELGLPTTNVEAVKCGRVDTSWDNASSNMSLHVSCSQTEMQDILDSDGISETQIDDERPWESSHHSSIDGVFNPIVWQNMSCDSELDSTCFENFPDDKDSDLYLSNGGTLIDNLTASDDIPDLDLFREISVSNQEETLRDDQPLYEDSSVSVSESSLLIMAFAVRHKLSGVAREDLLELIHLHCPKPNKCITEVKEFQLFFQALKHPILKHYYCPNIVCKVYIGTSEPENGTKCAVCATTLIHSAYFIEIPVMEQLKTILSRPEMIEKLQYRFRRVKIDPEAIEDVYDGQLYKTYSTPGGFLSDPHNISFLGNTDGVALIKSTSYGVWPV